MTVLVTGAGGFLGAAVTGACDDVVSARHGRRYAFDGRNAVIDLTCRAQVDRLIGELEPVSAVVHCAAVTPFNRAGPFDDGPNERMTGNLIRLCNRLGVARLVFASGWVVYAVDSTPVGERDRRAPATAYGVGKLRAEETLRRRLAHTVLACARLSSVYGPGQRSRGLIPNLLDAGMAGGPLRIGAVRTRRDYLHVADAATAVRRLLALELRDHLDVNLGSGTSVAVVDVARSVQRSFAAYGVELPLECANPPMEGAPTDNRLDIGLARRLGVLPTPRDLAEGLEECVAWRWRRK